MDNNTASNTPPDDAATTPLEALLTQHGLTNTDLVAASSEQLTYKQVQKARKGRKVSLNIQGKILRALNTLVPAREYTRQDLFDDEAPS